jgi:hypothetical protein
MCRGGHSQPLPVTKPRVLSVWQTHWGCGRSWEQAWQGEVALELWVWKGTCPGGQSLLTLPCSDQPRSSGWEPGTHHGLKRTLVFATFSFPVDIRRVKILSPVLQMHAAM